MGLNYHKRIKIADSTYLNIGKKGASISHKVGKNITVNSKGITTIKLGNGLIYRVSSKK